MVPSSLIGRHEHCTEACVVAAAAGASDERMMQLLRLLNRLLDKHPESRRRHLTFHTPAIVPVWMQVQCHQPGCQPLRPRCSMGPLMTFTKRWNSTYW